MNSDLTVGEALSAFRRSNGITAEEAATWTCDIGPLRLRLPNFRWRRRAIAVHDLHHVVTGYPCTLRGEFQMAAWEFAAGRFPHPGATLFCLPLVTAGMLWSPRAMWSAFRAGRCRRSFYGIELDAALCAVPLRSLRTILPARSGNTRMKDGAAFCILIALSIGWTFTIPALAMTLALVL